MSEANSADTGYAEKSDEEDSFDLEPIVLRPADKLRIRSVDPNECRCLVENVPEHCIVDYIRCYPKRKAGRQKLIAALEWHWNLQRGTLNLDTDYNVFPIRPHLGYLYENPRPSGSWMLLPPEGIVKRYHDALENTGGAWTCSRETFPNIEDGEFTYQFVPFEFEQSMRDLFITRQDKQRDADELPSASNYSVHSFPFTTLPLIRSHLHPKFVILEASRKLDGLEYVQAADLTDKYPILELVTQIATAWTQSCPDREFFLSLSSLSEPRGEGVPAKRRKIN